MELQRILLAMPLFCREDGIRVVQGAVLLRLRDVPKGIPGTSGVLRCQFQPLGSSWRSSSDLFGFRLIVRACLICSDSPSRQSGERLLAIQPLLLRRYMPHADCSD